MRDSANRGINSMFVCKILYFGGEGSPGGVLRAVVPLVRMKELLRQESVIYVGDAIPEELKCGTVPATVIQIHAAEQEAGWLAGFYRSAKSPSEFEGTIPLLE